MPPAPSTCGLQQLEAVSGFHPDSDGARGEVEVLQDLSASLRDAWPALARRLRSARRAAQPAPRRTLGTGSRPPRTYRYGNPHISPTESTSE